MEGEEASTGKGDPEMYERSYGPKYEPGLDTAEIAKRIRASVKTLVKAGTLPADWKYSVRTDRFAGGSAIRVRATSPRPIMVMTSDEQWEAQVRGGDPVRHPETGEWVRHYGESHTVEAAAVYAILKVEQAAYNFDGSETQVDYWDVNYYGEVNLDTAPGVPEALDADGRAAVLAETLAGITDRFEVGATYAVNLDVAAAWADRPLVYTIVERDDTWVKVEDADGKQYGYGLRFGGGGEYIQGLLWPTDRIEEGATA